MALDFARDGAEHYPGLAAPSLAAFRVFFDKKESRPGCRVDRLGTTVDHLGPASPIGAVASMKLGGVARPVRAIAFDKSEGANWALDWHQDRVIAVRERIDVAGFGPWTLKQGVHHVQPPIGLLVRMATVRVHLDAVDATNAPLKVAPGSHKFGRIEERDVKAVVARCGEARCLAEAGDAWIYATLILHASDIAAGRRRRVLQVDYWVDELPGGLEWNLA